MGLREVIREIAEKVDELEKLEEKAKTTRFKCVRSCGYICCTATEVMFNPFDSQFEMTEETLNRLLQFFPAVFPVLGADSKVPLLVKREMAPCPFYKKDYGCTIHEKKPASCSAYPAGRAYTVSPDDRASTETLIFLGNEVCPKEAFEEGEPLIELKEKLPSMEKTRRLVEEFTEKVKPLIPDTSHTGLTVLYSCRMLKAFAKEKTIEAMKEEVEKINEMSKEELEEEVRSLMVELIKNSKCTLADVIFSAGLSKEEHWIDTMLGGEEVTLKMVETITTKELIRVKGHKVIKLPIEDLAIVIPDDPEVVERASIAIAAAEELIKRR